MQVLQQMAAVAGVLVLLLATLWWLRRQGYAVAAGRRSGGRRLECVERLPLGPQQALHLIRVGNQALLVASSPAGCRLLTRCGDADPAGLKAAGQ